MTGKRRASDEDEDAIFQIDNDELGGVTIVEPNAPIARVRLTLSDELTATFPTKSLVADVQIGLADGTTRTVENLDPTFPVRADVTRRTTATPETNIRARTSGHSKGRLALTGKAAFSLSARSAQQGPGAASIAGRAPDSSRAPNVGARSFPLVPTPPG